MNLIGGFAVWFYFFCYLTINQCAAECNSIANRYRTNR
jgi:hypothetical protein